MLLPAELLSTAKITAANTGKLLRAVDRDGAVMWIVESDGSTYALFLTGKYAGRAFQISPESGGAGAVIGPIQVRVDPSSVTRDESAWSLMARDGSLLVGFQIEERGGFLERVWAPVAAIESLAEPSFYFSRWSLGLEVNGAWHELVTISDGRPISCLEAGPAETTAQ